MAWSMWDIGCCCGEGVSCGGPDTYTDAFTTSIDPGWEFDGSIAAADATINSGQLSIAESGASGLGNALPSGQMMQCSTPVDFDTQTVEMEVTLVSINTGSFSRIGLGFGIYGITNFIQVHHEHSTFVTPAEYRYNISAGTPVTISGVTPTDGDVLNVIISYDTIDEEWTIEVRINGTLEETIVIGESPRNPSWDTNDVEHGIIGDANPGWSLLLDDYSFVKA